MIFEFGNDELPEYVPEEALIEAMRPVVNALALQILAAREIDINTTGSTEKLNALMSGPFFYGYVVGACNKVAANNFIDLIAPENRGKNIQRLIQGVVANLFWPEKEKDWNAVAQWDAQAASYGIAQNPEYVSGMQAGVSLGGDIITGVNSNSANLLAAELLKL